MNSTTPTFIKEKLSTGLKAAITQAVYEVINDPDFTLELSEKAKRRLNKTKRSRGGGVSFSAIKRRYL